MVSICCQGHMALFSKSFSEFKTIEYVTLDDNLFDYCNSCSNLRLWWCCCRCSGRSQSFVFYFPGPVCDLINIRISQARLNALFLFFGNAGIVKDIGFLFFRNTLLLPTPYFSCAVTLYYNPCFRVL